jgi:ataxin-10
MDYRIAVGSDFTIWRPLGRLWKDLARAHSTFWETEESDGEENGTPKQLALATLCATVAKFTRNIVAGVPDNQSMAL